MTFVTALTVSPQIAVEGVIVALSISTSSSSNWMSTLTESTIHCSSSLSSSKALTYKVNLSPSSTSSGSLGIVILNSNSKSSLSSMFSVPPSSLSISSPFSLNKNASTPTSKSLSPSLS